MSPQLHLLLLAGTAVMTAVIVSGPFWSATDADGSAFVSRRSAAQKTRLPQKWMTNRIIQRARQTGASDNNRHTTEQLLVQFQRLATDAVVDGGEEYVARLLPVLTSEGLRLLMRAFLEPFHIAVETSCLVNDNNNNNNNNNNNPYNSSKYRSICANDPAHWPEGDCMREAIGSAWPTKFAAEWAIPIIIEKSPWVAAADGPVDAMVVHTNGLCAGPYRVVIECARRFDKTPPKRWPGHAKTFHFFMHDHGPCTLMGAPEFGFDAKTWASPIVSVNGERWSASASQPCHNPYRDIVVPTSNMIIPSFEGNILQRVAVNAAATTEHQRQVLAFMVMGSNFAHRAMMERLYDQDREIVVKYRLDHTEYMSMLVKSKFCLQLDGQAPWSPRLVEYIAVGCVPVLMSDTLLPPFQRLLNWSAFSVQVPLRQAAELKTILRKLVDTGEYTRLRKHVVVAAEAFKYYLDEPLRGATPLVVAEMMAVANAARAPPQPPFPPPYEWQRPHCLFLEDCPTGCDNSHYPENEGRDPLLANYTPCNPVLFQGCTRVSKDEAQRRISKDSNLLVISKVWGEPKGSSNVTLCARANDYEKLP